MSRTAGKGKGGKGKGARGRPVWKSKGLSLLEKLRGNQPTAVPRLYGQPLSADEYFLNAMAVREDAHVFADHANLETFGETGGWDVEEMLTKGRGEAPSLSQYIAGTSGFMGVRPQKYAARFSVVELNCTFHDRGKKEYNTQAAEYAKLGLQVVVKVSGYATHTACLENPGAWWSWLRSKYAPFVNAGILIGLLWQLPPSFLCTEDTLSRLDVLGALLRSPGQMPFWAALQHAFEFRHSSWYNDSRVNDVLQRHALSMVLIHIVNDTGWAGDLASGWHGLHGYSSPDFVYLRCFGNSGRSIGKYTASELQHMARQARIAGSAVVMFGQGDVPDQALDNAEELQRILEEPDSNSSDDSLRLLKIAACPEPHPGTPRLVSGRVIAVTKNWDRRVLLDVGGRRGYLGSRHSRKRGLSLRMGEVVENLRIEADTGAWLILSVHSTLVPTEHERQNRDEQVDVALDIVDDISVVADTAGLILQ